jgi:hypothetical protein
MKPLAYAVSSTLLILATYMNGFILYHVFGGQEYLDFVGTLLAMPLAVIVPAVAFGIISYGTKRTAFSTHPILSSIALLNMVYPVGRFIVFVVRLH